MIRIFISLAILLTTTIAGGKNSAMKSILIVYGSYSGSTAEIATKMKATLDNLNCKTVLMPASAVQTDLTQYDLIVIGSAIHGGFKGPEFNKCVYEYSNSSDSYIQKRSDNIRGKFGAPLYWGFDFYLRYQIPLGRIKSKI